MKTIVTTLLALSLVLNLAFGLQLLNARHRATPLPVTSSPRAAAARPAAPVIDGNVWPGLQTPDLRLLAERLRVAGFPPDLARAIIRAEVSRPFALRRAAAEARLTPTAFWKARSLLWSDYMAAIQQISREEHAAVRAALGDDADESDNPFSQLLRQRQIAGLPPEKAAEIDRISRAFNERRIAITGTYGAQNASQRAALDTLMREQHDAIIATLTPAERDIWELRNGSTATALRYQLATFNPTEDEFLALYRLQKPFDDQFGQFPMQATPEQVQQRDAALKQLGAEIKATLGPDRAADYERSADESYQFTNRLVSRLNLPAETANQVWSVQRDAIQRADAIRQDRSLSSTQQQQQLAALGAEAEAKITGALGPTGFMVYQQNAGRWLRNMRPKSPPPNP